MRLQQIASHFAPRVRNDRSNLLIICKIHNMPTIQIFTIFNVAQSIYDSSCPFVVKSFYPNLMCFDFTSLPRNRLANWSKLSGDSVVNSLQPDFEQSTPFQDGGSDNLQTFRQLPGSSTEHHLANTAGSLSSKVDNVCSQE